MTLGHRLRAVPLLFLATGGAALTRAQTPPTSPPAPLTALSEALMAACRQSAEQFAAYLTSENAAVYRSLPPDQRIALMQRFVQLAAPGRPLLSNDASGRPLFRCETPGVTALIRFGDARVQDNLAFIPVTAGIPGDKPGDPDRSAPRDVQFGLVRESGQWKLLSVGLLLLDLPALARQWAREDLTSREEAAIASLREIARALGTYRRAFGTLPESLARMGPAPREGISEDAASLIDAELAAGTKGGYSFRYRIVPPRPGVTATDEDGQDGFELAATPTEYGKTGQRSFFLDSSGTLRGDDKKGAVATVTDAVVKSPREPR